MPMIVPLVNLMKLHIKFVFFMLLLMITILSTGAAYAEERLAILKFRNNEKALSSSEISYIGEVFRDLGAKMGKRDLLIMTKENILQLLPPGKSLEQCIGECEVETGRKIGADYILSGEVTKLTSGYRLTVRIHNTKTGGVVSSEIYEGKTFELLETDIRSNSKKDVFRPIRSRMFSSEFQEKSFGEKAGAVQTWDANTAIVQFDTDPKGALVEIDGNVVCQQTPCSKEVGLGNHELAFKLMKYLSHVEQIDVKADMKPVVRVLKANFGLVTLKTEPNDGLEVFLDNKSIGRTPLATLRVEPRPHKLVVKGNGYYEKGLEFTIERGEKRDIVLKPDPKLGALRIVAKDDKGNDVVAEVTIDGKSVGKTPWRGPLVVGNHELKVTHPTGVWQENYLVRFNEKQQIIANLLKIREGNNNETSLRSYPISDTEKAVDDASLTQTRTEYRTFLIELSLAYTLGDYKAIKQGTGSNKGSPYGVGLQIEKIFYGTTGLRLGSNYICADSGDGGKPSGKADGTLSFFSLLRYIDHDFFIGPTYLAGKVHSKFQRRCTPDPKTPNQCKDTNETIFNEGTHNISSAGIVFGLGNMSNLSNKNKNGTKLSGLNAARLRLTSGYVIDLSSNNYSTNGGLILIFNLGGGF